MTIKKTIFISMFLLWTVVCGPWTKVYGEIPKLINYQGRITDAQGAPLTGSYAVTFRIYDAASGGNLLWEETHSGLVVDKGLFNVLLGSVTAFNIAFDRPYFLEIKVGSEVMSPRQQIAASAYAMRANVADSVAGADVTKIGYVGTKAVDESQIADSKVPVYKASSNKLQYENMPKVKTGTYVGNGQANQSLTGFGFAPKWVQVVSTEPTVRESYIKTPNMPDGYSRGMNSSWATVGIKSPDSDGFTVGPHAKVNTVGVTYAYLAVG